MQLLTLAALFGIAFAVNPLLEARGTRVCSAIQDCVSSHFDIYAATTFCASYNSVPTVTTGTTTINLPCSLPLPPSSYFFKRDAVPTAVAGEARDAAAVVAPVYEVREAAVTPAVHASEKPRCFKRLQDGHLSKACSCIIQTVTVPAHHTYTCTPSASVFA